MHNKVYVPRKAKTSYILNGWSIYEKYIKFLRNLSTSTHKNVGFFVGYLEFFVGYSDCFITVNNYEVVELFLIPSA